MDDNPDSLVNQEVLSPGQLFLMFLKVSACVPALFRGHCATVCRLMIPSVSILHPLFFAWQ
jgi:hypothetical protein